MDDREPHPSLKDRSIGLLKADRLATTDTERLEHHSGCPRQLGAGVDQNVAQQSPVSFPQWGLELDVGAQKTHIVGHGTSRCPEHYNPIIAGRVKRARPPSHRLTLERRQRVEGNDLTVSRA